MSVPDGVMSVPDGAEQRPARSWCSSPAWVSSNSASILTEPKLGLRTCEQSHGSTSKSSRAGPTRDHNALRTDAARIHRVVDDSGRVFLHIARSSALSG